MPAISARNRDVWWCWWWWWHTHTTLQWLKRGGEVHEGGVAAQGVINNRQVAHALEHNYSVAQSCRETTPAKMGFFDQRILHI